MKYTHYVLTYTLLIGLCISCMTHRYPWKEVDTIVFIGDSITYDGRFIGYMKSLITQQDPSAQTEMINLGKSSETVSGLSEEIHDPPRPILFDRLSAEIGHLSPDFVVFCYGINDGIYKPFSEDRFTAYKNGVVRFLDDMNNRSIQVVLLTPPPLVLTQPVKTELLNDSEYSWKHPYPRYNDEVLKLYADHIMSISHPAVILQVDIHTPLMASSLGAYDKDPIHPNQTGHSIIAGELFNAFNSMTDKKTL